MKKEILAISSLAIVVSLNSQADYMIKIPLDSPIKFSNWQEHDSIYGEWTNNNGLYGCSNWTPSTSEVTINLEYTQTATDCSQDQIRTVQDQTIDTVSGQVVNDGDPYTESRTITVSDSRPAIGTMETWVATIPLYITSWTNTGPVYGCQTWSPSPTTITINQQFTQTSNDCKQDQERTRQDREQETTTNEIRNVGSPVTETQTITASSTRTATGTKETWVATTPTYTSWTNINTVYGCTNWSPPTSDYNVGVQFTQTATDCKQDQTRSRQNREQETTTLAIRNSGSPITENQTITTSSTRQATGTKPVEECLYATGASGSIVSSSGYYDYDWMTSYNSWVFRFKGTLIKSGTGQLPSSVTSGSYIYTRGAYMDGYDYDDDWASYYQICRKPL